MCKIHSIIVDMNGFKEVFSVVIRGTLTRYHFYQKIHRSDFCFYVMYSTYMYCQVVHAYICTSQTVGVTTTVCDEVPDYLLFNGAGNNEWYYDGNIFYHNHSSTKYSHLPSLDDLKFGNNVGLLLLPNGELHLFLDGKNSAKVATGLPVHKSLFGAVDVRSRCTKIKSEILSGELDGVCLYTSNFHVNLYLGTILMYMDVTLW